MDRLISFLPSSSTAKTTQFSLSFKRLLLPISLAALVAAPATRELTVTTLSDAFWAVSCYVALTLAVYHWLALYINKDKLWYCSENKGEPRLGVRAEMTEHSDLEMPVAIGRDVTGV